MSLGPDHPMRIISRLRRCFSSTTSTNIASNVLRRCLSSTAATFTATEVLPGGHTKSQFIFITEKVSPFVREVLGLEVVTVSKGNLSMSMKMKEQFVGNPRTKVLHGGVISAALDHVGGFTAWSVLDDPSMIVSTVDLRIDYLSPCPYETLHVEGKVVSVKKKLIRADIELKTVQGQIIAVARGLWNIYKPPK